MNSLINTIQALGWKLANVTEVMEAQIKELKWFLKQYLQVLTVNDIRYCNLCFIILGKYPSSAKHAILETFITSHNGF